MGFASFSGSAREISGAFGGSGASGGLRGPPGASGSLGGLLGACGPALEISVFPGTLQGEAWPVTPHSAQPETPEAKVAGFRVTNNLVNHSKGERSPRRGSCPSTWRCSSRSTNSLGLHSISKLWCE